MLEEIFTEEELEDVAWRIDNLDYLIERAITWTIILVEKVRGSDGIVS